MSRSGWCAWALVFVLSACNSELRVLEPRTPVSPLTVDAGSDAASNVDLDARSPDNMRDGAGPSIDASMFPTETVEPDGAVLPASEARTVSAFTQTCAVRDGALFCWGDDSSGQLGIAGNSAQPRPVAVEAGDFIDSCAGEVHSCALRSNGEALCWGDNTHGQLGVGDFMARELPTELTARRFTAIACGGRNTCALAQRGQLFCWGENAEGKLGQGDASPEMQGTLPDSPAPLALPGDRSFVQVSLGQGHVCAISEEGALFCWGRNTSGQLGVRDMAVQQRTPVEVEPGTHYARVAAGQRHSCAIDIDGALFCWGENSDNLLGLKTDVALVRTPSLVGDNSDYTAVAASWFHTCALKKAGSLLCWGRNQEGQLGLGDSMARATPTRISPQLAWSSFALGQFHTCAFAKDGLYCWGNNDMGELGVGDTARRYVPVAVQFP